MEHTTTYRSPLGILTLASDGEALTGLWLEGQKYFGGPAAGTRTQRDDLPVFDAARDWLDRYFAGAQPLPGELPLHPVGGEFRQRVWELLREIPYGQVTTYGALARALAKIDNYAHYRVMPGATQSTAHMCIINPFSGIKGNLMNLFSTHPSTENRIARLEALDRELHG